MSLEKQQFLQINFNFIPKVLKHQPNSPVTMVNFFFTFLTIISQHTLLVLFSSKMTTPMSFRYADIYKVVEIS